MLPCGHTAGRIACEMSFGISEMEAISEYGKVVLGGAVGGET
jgi:hypothetical protein